MVTACESVTALRSHAVRVRSTVGFSVHHRTRRYSPYQIIKLDFLDAKSTSNIRERRRVCASGEGWTRCLLTHLLLSEVLDTVVDVKHYVALPPSKGTVRILDLDIALRDEAITQHDADILKGRARIILLGHPINRDFAACRLSH